MKELTWKQQLFLGVLKHEEVLKRCLNHVIFGDYGEDEYQKTKRILSASKRANKVAQISKQIARVECNNLNSRHAVEVYYAMNQEQRETANKIIQDAVDTAVI